MSYEEDLEKLRLRAERTLGSKIKAARWMSKKNRSLSGQTPTERIRQGKAQDVKDVLDRIEFSLHS
ncbi:MAG: MbcA/ParS/Xre antitoxin family protein [Sedimenticola sp.]